MSAEGALPLRTHAVLAQRHNQTHLMHPVCLQHLSQVLGGPLVSQLRGEALEASVLCLSTLQEQMPCHCHLQDAIASAQNHRPSTSAPQHQYFPPINPEDRSQQDAGLAQATSNVLG